jgi:hypothetical protein
MKTTLATLAVLSAAALLGACGGQSNAGQGPLASWSGLWTVDVDRTFSSPSGGHALRSGAGRAHLEERFSPDAYRLELSPDGTFLTTLTWDGRTTSWGGEWRMTDAGPELTTTQVDGAPAPEGEERVSQLTTEGTGLVKVEGDWQIHLHRP